MTEHADREEIVTRKTKREDHFTNTPEDAARYEARRGESDDAPEPADREASLTDLNPECTCRGCVMQLERDEARATIERVKELHFTDDDDGRWCNGCDTQWPCLTIEALEQP